MLRVRSVIVFAFLFSLVDVITVQLSMAPKRDRQVCDQKLDNPSYIPIDGGGFWCPVCGKVERCLKNKARHAKRSKCHAKGLRAGPPYHPIPDHLLKRNSASSVDGSSGQAIATLAAAMGNGGSTLEPAQPPQDTSDQQQLLPPATDPTNFDLAALTDTTAETSAVFDDDEWGYPSQGSGLEHEDDTSSDGTDKDGDCDYSVCLVPATTVACAGHSDPAH